MDIESKVKGIIVTVLCIEGSTFSTTENFSDMGADSLDAVELIMAIEDEFQVEISDEEAQACVNAQSIIDLVGAKLAK